MTIGMPKLLIFLFFTLSLVQTILTDDLVFASPGWSCNTGGCTGTPTNPMNNLFDAFELATHFQSAQVILLYNSSSPDYYLMMNSTSSNSYLDFVVKKLVIRPLFCNDNIITPSLLTLCFQPQQKARIILKTTQFSLIINETLTIKNVIFDALENIKIWNENSSQLDDCLYNPKKCCQEGQELSVLPQSGSSVPLWCEWHGNTSKLSISPSSSSLFVMRSSNDTSIVKSLIFENTEFLNFQSPQLESLIQVGHSPSTLTFNQTKINRIYFGSGLISSTVDLNDPAMPSSIIVQDTSFSNYNIWNIVHPSGSSSKREGFFFHAQDGYKGSLQIIRSTFLNSTSSLRNSCWSQTSQPSYYNLPMNNLLTSQPRSRSNLWKQYHQESYQNQNEYVSSLILISKMDGDLVISDSTFKNIVGTSGSVLRIDDISSPDTSFNISSTSFDGNFAFDRFANIMIVRSSDPFFSSIVDCPILDISKSNFTNAYGCPGAYGNFLYLCYLDSQPSEGSSLSNYSLGTKANDFLTAMISLSSQEENEALYAIKVKESIFRNNLLSVSNSLAIIGAHSVLFLRNIFQDNGGTTAEIAQVSLQGSYFLSRYPTAVSFPLPLTHFGQSSTVYLNHLIKIYSKGNIYQGNWGPWEGSLALGSSITIKNWIRIKNGLKFYEEVFTKHNGIPASITGALTDESLANNVNMDPIVTISLDIEGSNIIRFLNANFDFVGPVNILLKNVKFQENTVSYNYGSFTYNENEIRMLISNMDANRNRYNSGLIKTLWESESRDDLSYGFNVNRILLKQGVLTFSEGEISFNELVGSGCLFSNVFFLERLQIIGNKIYMAAEFFDEDQLFITFFYSVVETPKGVFCMSPTEYSGAILNKQMTGTNLIVKYNKGRVFHVMTNTFGKMYITNSIFMQNVCKDLSLIVIDNLANFASINNLFIDNFSSTGVMFLFNLCLYNGVFNSFLRNNGTYAAVTYYLNMVLYFSFESCAKAYWNSINPKFRVKESGDMTNSAALIYLAYSRVNIINSAFRENNVYSGVLYVVSRKINLYDCLIADNNVTGAVLVGTFISNATLTIRGLQINNNTLIRDPTLPKMQGSFFQLSSCILDWKNVTIDSGSVSQTAYLVLANLAIGTIKNMTIKNFYRLDQGQYPLIYLSTSNIDFFQLKCSNTTGLFHLIGSSLDLNSLHVENLRNEYESQFIFWMLETFLNIYDFKYQGNGEVGSLLPLFGGDKNRLTIRKGRFLNACEGQNSVFKLQTNYVFMIVESIFEYQNELTETKIFDLSSAIDLVIQNNIFNLAGKILSLSESQGKLYFIGNTIITNSHLQNFVLENIDSALMAQNYFLRHNNQDFSSLPDSLIQVTNLKHLFSFRGNRFISLYGGNGIIEIISTENPYATQFSQDVFLGNTASNGGALYFRAQKGWSDDNINPISSINNLVFIANKALTWKLKQGKGGAIYQTSSGQTKQINNIENTIFVKNYADRVGGAIFFDYSPPNISSNCIFKENNATILNHIYSYPVRLVESKNYNYLHKTYIPGTSIPKYTSSGELSVWENVGSGISTNATYIFVLIDMFGQILYDDSSSALEIYPVGFNEASRILFSDRLSIKAENGEFTLSNFRFNYKVQEALNITFKTTAIQNFSVLPVEDLTLAPAVTVKAHFRQCGMGEFFVTLSSYVGCQECPEGFWQVNPDIVATACTACDYTSMICLGGRKVGPQQGYWRMNETADLVFECPRIESCINNEGTITVSTINTAGKCAEGFNGNLCNNCNPGWAKGSNDNCIDCNTDVLQYFILFGGLFLQSALIAFGVRKTIEIGKDFARKNHIETGMATLLRIFMNYSQVFSLIMSIPVGWPTIMDKTIGVSGKIAAFGDKIFSANCFFLLIQDSTGTKMVFLKALYTATIPIFFIMTAILYWVVYFRTKKKTIWGNKELLDKIITTIVIICFNVQAQVITSSFSLFKCQNLYRKDTPINFMVEDYDTECWVGDHFLWTVAFALPCLLIWIIILPGLVLYALIKNRFNLEADKVVSRYCFLYNGYKDKKYYWEFYILIRKLLIAIITVFAGIHSVNLQILLVIVVMFISFIIQIVNKPYAKNHLNTIERLSLTSLCTVSLCGISFQFLNDAQALKIIITVIGVIGILWFILYFLRSFIVLQLAKIKRNPKLMKIYNFVEKYLCCCLEMPHIKKVIKKLRSGIRKLSYEVAGDQVAVSLTVKSTMKTSAGPTFKSKPSLFARKAIPTIEGIVYNTTDPLNSPQEPEPQGPHFSYEEEALASPVYSFDASNRRLNSRRQESISLSSPNLLRKKYPIGEGLNFNTTDQFYTSQERKNVRSSEISNDEEPLASPVYPFDGKSQKMILRQKEQPSSLNMDDGNEK